MLKLTEDNLREKIYLPLANTWIKRAEDLGLQPNSRNYREKELEFFLGAATSLDLIMEAHETSFCDPIITFSNNLDNGIAHAFLNLKS